MKTTILAVLAGAAMASSAFAQTSLDRDRAYAAELNADAANRTSQLAASNEGAFKLTAGSNTLYVGGLAQFRYNQDFRSDKVGDSDDFTHGFNIPNVKLRFWGNVYDQNLKYKIQGRWGDTEGESSFTLEDAFSWYEWESGLWVKWGQFKLPILREELVANEHQLAVARSITNDVFSQGWSQGVELGYQTEQFRIMGDFSDGWRTANTDFNSANEADYALTARVEFQAMSTDWTRWDDFTSWRGSDSGLLIGAAVHWETAGETGDTVPGNPNDVDFLLYTLDAAFEGNGWNLYAAFIGSNVDPEFGRDTDNFGVIFQGGVFVTEQVELFARFDWLSVDEKITTPDLDPSDYYFLTGGLNYYISPNSHAAKFTANITYAFEQTNNLPSGLPGLGGAFVPNTSAQVLGDGDDGEISWAAQLQLMF